MAFLFLTGQVIMAQPIAIGVKGGVQLTDDFGPASPAVGGVTSESKRYIVGPALDVRLPVGWSFEFDVLYRRLDFTASLNGGLSAGFTTVKRASSWEFPLMLKYHFLHTPVHPFVGGGFAPRIIRGTEISSGTCLCNGPSPTPFSSHSETNYPTIWGSLISGGVELGTGHLRVSPEVRYAYWSPPFFKTGLQTYDYKSKQNEVSIFLGISWR